MKLIFYYLRTCYYYYYSVLIILLRVKLDLKQINNQTTYLLLNISQKRKSNLQIETYVQLKVQLIDFLQ